MRTSHSDALVVYGVTGDLAHKMIFPALYAMVKRGTLNVPVIGVAFPKWSLERLQRRVTHSIKQSGGIDNRRAFQHLLSLLKYVSGDYNDSDTFASDQASARQGAPSRTLPRHPSLALRDCNQRAGRRRVGGECARHRGEAVWTRPGIGSCAEPGGAVGFP